jgi:ribose transport system permease protein
MSIKLKNFLVKYSRLIILILLAVFFSLTTTTFWSPGNWDNVLNIILQQAPFSVMLAICMTLSIILKGLDLSIGAGVAIVSCLLGMILNATYNAWLGILAALAIGAVIGLCNGLLISKVKVSPYIATYSMQWILKGLALVLLGGRQIYDLGPNFRPLFISSKFTFFIIAAVVVIIMMFLLNKTTFGRQVYATGTNIEAARISGIKTDRIYIIVFLINGLIMAMAAIMFTANLGCAEPVIGDNFPINAVAATLIGGNMIGGGTGRISSTVIGALILLVLTNGMVMIGVPSVWQQFVIGAVIVASVIMERGMQKIAVESDN